MSATLGLPISGSPETVAVGLPVRAFTIALVASVAIVTIVGVPVTVAASFGKDGSSTLTRLFHLDGEANVPAWVATMQLLAAAVLLWFLAQSPGLSFGRRWNLLSVLFLGASLDEASQLHEMLIWPLKKTLAASGPFYFAWVIAGIPFVLLLAGWFWKPVMSLPRGIKAMSMAAAALYVGGAVGMEMIDGAWADAHGTGNPTYAMLVSVEETLELIGIAMWNVALLRYLALCHREGPPVKAAHLRVNA